MENRIVRNNLLTEKGYTPNCGDELCKPRTTYSPERWPRTIFNGEQFVCPKCGWVSEFPNDFIEKYKETWKTEKNCLRGMRKTTHYYPMLATKGNC